MAGTGAAALAGYGAGAGTAAMTGTGAASGVGTLARGGAGALLTISNMLGSLVSDKCFS